MTAKVFDARGRLVDADLAAREPAETGRAVRTIYGLALVSIALPAPMSGWVGMALGVTSVRAFVPMIWFIPFALIAWRIVLVIRRSGLLDAPSDHQALRWCRKIGTGLMAVGMVIYLLQWFVVPLARTVFPRGSDNGIEFFVLGLGFAMLAAATPIGLLLFEASRLLGFERWYREQRS